MESFTNILDPAIPDLCTSTATTPATRSQPATPEDSPTIKPTNLPAFETTVDLRNAKADAKTENNLPAAPFNLVIVRPTLPHAQTDTAFEVAKGVQRVEWRWRGMYDRNQAANPGATQAQK